MSRLRDALVLIFVAGAVPGSSFVLGQVLQGQGQFTIAFFPVQAEVPKKEAPKADPKSKDGVVKKEAAGKGAARKQAVRKAAVLKQAIAVPAAPAAVVLDAQAAQYVEQFRPMFKAEYYFIGNACTLTKDQRKQLSRLGETAIKTAARQFVEAQQKMMRGGWRPGTEYPDPRKLIEEVLGRSTTGFLSPVQQERYRQELGKRTESRKQVVIDNLVAKLDQDLVLTSQQRDKLVQALRTNWNDSWGQSLEMLQNINNFFPNIPDQVVAPILTDLQKESWRRIPKNSGGFWGFNVGGIVMDPDPLDDPELAEVRKEAQAKEKK